MLEVIQNVLLLEGALPGVEGYRLLHGRGRMHVEVEAHVISYRGEVEVRHGQVGPHRADRVRVVRAKEGRAEVEGVDVKHVHGRVAECEVASAWVGENVSARRRARRVRGSPGMFGRPNSSEVAEEEGEWPDVFDRRWRLVREGRSSPSGRGPRGWPRIRPARVSWALMFALYSSTACLSCQGTVSKKLF